VNQISPALDISERDLQRNVRQFATDLGWKIAVTWNSLHSPKGWPDLFLVRCDTCRRGDCEYPDGSHTSSFIAIELKSQKGKVSEHQEAWLAALRAAGARYAGVIRPSNWYAGELDEVLR